MKTAFLECSGSHDQESDPEIPDTNPTRFQQSLRRSDGASLVINKVSEDVEQIKEQIRHLSADIVNIDEEALKKDPARGHVFMESLHKKTLQSTENLMKELLTLDALVGANRDQRKQQVLAIQNLLAGTLPSFFH